MSKLLPTSLEKYMEFGLDNLCAIENNGYFVSVSQESEKIRGSKLEEIEWAIFLEYVALQNLEAIKN